MSVGRRHQRVRNLRNLQTPLNCTLTICEAERGAWSVGARLYELWDIVTLQEYFFDGIQTVASAAPWMVGSTW